MRPGVLGPRAGLPPEAATPLAVIALLWGGLAIAGVLWLCGAAAGWMATRVWAPPPFSFDTAGAVVEVGAPQTFGASSVLLYGMWIAAGVGLSVAAGLWFARGGMRPPADDPLQSMARPSDVATMTPKGAAARARDLRPSLRSVAASGPDEFGVAVGELLPGGVLLRSSWEDVMLAIMAPRAGKTTSLAVPMVLSAPGPVIATSNKADLVAATEEIRARAGTCWVFDPQGIARTPRKFTFNPLSFVREVTDADRLAQHFVQELSDDAKGQDFWAKAAADLLGSLLMAAAVSGRDLAEVYKWLNDSASRIPVELLRKHHQPQLAAGLEGRQSGAVETREGIYETARTAAQSLRDPRIMAWVTPDPSLPAFDPRTFAASADTVYAMSKDGGGSAAPLVAALVDSAQRAGQNTAEASAGRLDPPMVLVLDEAANVAKIKDLPALYSHLGSRGLMVATILQSYRQGVRVWGEDGMGTLWSAATIKLIGAGIDDPKLAEDVSKLVGDHDVMVRSTTHGRDSSHQVSLRRQRILPPEAVRALPRGRAILLVTGVRGAMLRLRPWYSGPRAGEITAALKAAQGQITARARAEQEGVA